MNSYMKVSDASVKWGISNRRIVTLCNEGRIDGAITMDIYAEATDEKKQEIMANLQGKIIV